MSLSSGDEAPHIFTRKSRLKPGEFLITSAKRLLQQNRHKASEAKASNLRQLLFRSIEGVSAPSSVPGSQRHEILSLLQVLVRLLDVAHQPQHGATVAD